MCSFNEINDEPTNASSRLLRDVLRCEWGWDGMMVSDWGSIMQMIAQGHVADLREASAVAATAGVDMDMESHAYSHHLKGPRGERRSKRGNHRRPGAQRAPPQIPSGPFRQSLRRPRQRPRFYTDANLDGARRAAEESAILLTNNGVLPLADNVGRIAVTGPMMDAKHDRTAPGASTSRRSIPLRLWKPLGRCTVPTASSPLPA